MESLAAMGLTTPAMIAGLVLVSLPVAAHLLNRRARRRLVFPSIMLLSESSASQAQLFKLRRWLLLLLRCLIVALIVLAFARPIWLNAGMAMASRDRTQAVVMVLDVSASSGQRGGGISAIQSIKAAASGALGDLLAGTDLVNLVIADARPRQAFASMTTNVAAVRTEILALEPTFERADLPGALGLAGQLLAEHDGPGQLLIISDMQRTNWQWLVDGQTTALLPQQTQVTLVPAVTEPPTNIGLSSPMVRPRVPTVAAPVTASVTVTNHGGESQTVGLDMLVDRQVRDSRSFELAGGEQREIAFTLKPDQPGNRRISFAIGDDALTADNQAHLPVTIHQRVPILIIGDDSPDQPGSASYFIWRSLAPHGDMRDRLTPRHVSPSGLTAGQLEDAAVVILAYAAVLPDAALDLLNDYLGRGGGVVFYCGDGPVDRHLQRWNELADEPVIPWRLAGRRMLDAQNNLLYLGRINWQSRLWRDFDPAVRDVWSQIRFWRVWAAQPVDAVTAPTIMRFADGSPAMTMVPVGEGRLVLANFSPAAPASDIGKYGAFVALSQALVPFVQADRPGRAGITAGQSITMNARAVAPEDAPTLEVAGPDGQPVTPLTFSGDARQLAVTVDRSDLPGFYQVRLGERVLSTVAVNVDARESDLATVDPGRITAALQGAQVDRARVRNLTDQQQLLQLRGKPLWGWALAIAIALVAVELALLSYWRR
jgi:hypothetical protein